MATMEVIDVNIRKIIENGNT